MTRQRKRIVFGLSIVLFIAALAAPGARSAPAPEDARRTARLGLSPELVDPDVNPDDALAATSVWAETIGRGSGLWEKAVAKLFQDLPSLVAAVNAGRIDAAALGTQEFLAVERDLRADPHLTYSRAGHAEIEYLLIVRSDRGIRDPAGLAGRQVSALRRGGTNNLGSIWVEVLLGESGVGINGRQPAQIREAQKPSQAILPVFFGQSDAAVVTRAAFETAAALNPQIGQELKVLAVSPPLVTIVVCFAASLPVATREGWVQKAIRLHETPGGMQTFTIFKTDRLLRWEPRFADPVRNLIQRHARLKAAGCSPLALKASAGIVK